MKGDNKEKMRVKHAQDRIEDLQMLSVKECPWTKRPCNEMVNGDLVMSEKARKEHESHCNKQPQSGAQDGRDAEDSVRSG